MQFHHFCIEFLRFIWNFTWEAIGSLAILPPRLFHSSKLRSCTDSIRNNHVRHQISKQPFQNNTCTRTAAFITSSWKDGTANQYTLSGKSFWKWQYALSVKYLDVGQVSFSRFPQYLRRSRRVCIQAYKKIQKAVTTGDCFRLVCVIRFDGKGDEKMW